MQEDTSYLDTSCINITKHKNKLPILPNLSKFILPNTLLNYHQVQLDEHQVPRDKIQKPKNKIQTNPNQEAQPLGLLLLVLHRDLDP